MKNKDPEILGAFREFEINSTIRFRQELDTQTYTRPYAGGEYYMYLQTNTRAVLSGKISSKFVRICGQCTIWGPVRALAKALPSVRSHLTS